MHTALSWVPDLSATSGPMYERIAQALTSDIRSGKLKPGDQLPPNRELSALLGVTVGTVSRAFGEVVRARLIETGARRGTRVRDVETGVAVAASAGMSPSRAATADLRGHQTALKSWGRDIGHVLSQLTASQDLDELLRYADPAGRVAHRQAGAQWLGRGSDVPVDPARVVVVDGAQHALLCGLMAIAKAGDSIATERLTYTGLKTVAPLLGLHLVPVDCDERGMVPASLRQAMAAHTIKAVVCVPNIHNPTTATMPLDRRQELADTARQSGVFLLEDDVYGGLVDTPCPALAELAPEWTLRITSFSKALGPGLRVGFMQTPPSLTAAVVEAVRATTWMASPLTAEVATQLITSGRAESVLQENRQVLRERNTALQTAFAGFELQLSACSPHAWLMLPEPWTADQFCRWSEQAGFRVSPAEIFAVRRSAGMDAVRLSTSAAQDTAELVRFGALAAGALARAPQTPSDGMFP